MITPNKVIPLDQSAIGLMDIVLSEGNDATTLGDLFRKVGRQFESIDQFLLTVDSLYVLRKIDLDPKEGVVRFVD